MLVQLMITAQIERSIMELWNIILISFTTYINVNKS